MVPRWPIPLLLCSLLFAGCGPPEPIRIGLLAGLTGSASELGIEARRSLELSMAAINKAGGVKGRPLELLALDDGNEPSQALAAYQRFEREKVAAVLGPLASTVLSEIVPYLNEHRLLTISPTAAAASVAGRDDWFFRVITLNEKMGQMLAAYAAERQFTDIAVLRETSNDAYTRPVLEAFRSSLEARGMTVRASVEFDLRRQPDYGILAQSLGDAPAYLILANGYDSAQVGQQLALLGRLNPILAPPWAMTPEVIRLGGRQVERMVFASIFDSQSRSPGWLSFRDSYLSVYGEEPGFSAIYARDALTLLVLALRNAPSLEPQDLRDSLKAVGEVEGLQSSFRLDASGDVARDLFLLTVREGRFVRSSP